MNARFVARSARLVALSVVAVALVGVPLWMVVVNSFKTQTEAAALDIGLPTQWALVANYVAVFEQSDYLRGLGNSLLITGVSVGALLAIGAPAAWAFARSRSRVMAVLYWTAVVGVLLPLPVVPLVFLMQQVGLQGTQLGLILFTVGARISMVIFLMTGFARGLPRELEEAASMDGASRARTFVSVVLPLMSPVMLTTFVVVTVLVWNDFYGPLFLIANPEHATLPLGLYRLSSGISQATAWNYVFTHVVLVSLPLIAVYAFAQRRIVEGVTAGAIRG
ncbi:MAG: carbohydrate ABC transporter permease [Actinobacteria bacterium HGW-Actinobacteria-4]|nr:MAG: carbohydrate ABC transporter permease [Actinobacteria bacterium HGW-Actinobacteria-4]